MPALELELELDKTVLFSTRTMYNTVAGVVGLGCLSKSYAPWIFTRYKVRRFQSRGVYGRRRPAMS